MNLLDLFAKSITEALEQNTQLWVFGILWFGSVDLAVSDRLTQGGPKHDLAKEESRALTAILDAVSILIGKKRKNMASWEAKERHSTISDFTSAIASINGQISGFAMMADPSWSTAVRAAFYGVRGIVWNLGSHQGAITCGRIIWVSACMYWLIITYRLQLNL